MPASGGRPVRAVVFDIGGILEPPFDDVLIPELAAILGMPPARLTDRRAASAVALSEGRLTLRDFYARIGMELGRPVDPDAVVARHLAVYQAATATLDARVLGLIRVLRERHLVACLTNTEIEVARFNRERGLFRPFDQAFVSTELGLHKPDCAIFERVLTDLGCAPADVVFTDDNLDNALGARAVGIHAIHYRGFEEFSSELAPLIAPIPDGRRPQ
jgi:putative hydrolase of the HAD superfamily